MSDQLPKISLRLGDFPGWDDQFTAWAMYKGIWNVVSGDTKCPSALPSGSKAEDTTVHDKEVADWKGIDQHTAGAIMLMLSSEERTTLRDHCTSGSALYAAIHARHVQEKPASRYNTYLEFLGLRRNDGEDLTAFVSRVKDSMRRCQERCPDGFTLWQLDTAELMCMATLRALSDDPSCAVLVSMLLHSADNLSKIDKLKTELSDEDMNRKTSPALYGLKVDPHGVLRAAEVVDAANAASSVPAPKKAKPAVSGTLSTPATTTTRAVCAHCKGKHPSNKCFQKQITDLQAKLNSASVALASFVESAGSATTAHALLSSGLDNGADDVWVADTGATAHMMPHREWFASYSPLRTPIHLADGNIVHSAGVGTVVFTPHMSDSEIEFPRVLHIPALSCNLFSVLHLVRSKGFIVCAKGDTISFALAGDTLFTATITERNTAVLDGMTVVSMPSALRATLPLNLTLWHRRTMHHHLAGLQRALHDHLVTGVKLSHQHHLILSVSHVLQARCMHFRFAQLALLPLAFLISCMLTLSRCP